MNVIVANCGGGLKTSVDVGVVDFIALFGAVGPDAGETVCLEFEIDGKRICLRRILPGDVANLLFDAEDVLNVMTQLMGQDIGLGELRVAAA